METEGYIKFDCKITNISHPTISQVGDILLCRNELYKLGLIGSLPNGIGFGNISKRNLDGRIIISGSATGVIDNLSTEHFVFVESFSIDNNQVCCSGKLPASSETLTHIAIYEAKPSVNYVAHIHNAKIWEHLMSNSRHTTGNSQYGTIEIAHEVQSYCSEHCETEGSFALSGHFDGVMIFSDKSDRILEICKILNVW